MDVFARKLKERAEQLGISNAEAARRCDLDERRYAHYVSGRREPDLATLVKISQKLGTTPNWLLGLSSIGTDGTARTDMQDRLISAAQMMQDEKLRHLVIQAEALAAEDIDRR